MINIFIALTLIFLTLIQFTFLPINLSFLVVLLLSLYLKNYNKFLWVSFVSFLVSIFGNFQIGYVLLAYSLVLVLLTSAVLFLPSTRLSKAGVFILAIPLTEISLILFAIRS